MMPAFCHLFGSINDLRLELSLILLYHLWLACVFVHPPPLGCLTRSLVHGSWSHWSDWSECEACTQSSTRTRECNSPPSRFGGLPCIGERRQSRGCHDNFTVCSGWHYKWLHLCNLGLLKCTKCMNGWALNAVMPAPMFIILHQMFFFKLYPFRPHKSFNFDIKAFFHVVTLISSHSSFLMSSLNQKDFCPCTERPVQQCL